ncbi:DNA oxidative demethylase ALKBH2 [Varanus komodoensis]|uniref:DNA oxidative demethylase ALKBH2 n=1 Tax=Varanus komodoensis TaxID=61221 RepID=UPI001CF7B7B8|nr:DNA oxidative demethylase ALKBH2 [Varanus komodoensis]KAF7240705.1 DNA oxidative demethylase ALKBH2 [Varanus komodoensis]
MDRFLLRGPLTSTAGQAKRASPGREEDDASPVEEDGGGTAAKRPRRDTASRDERISSHARWRHIQAQGLSCDYKILFGKAEADAIFQELEKEVEYFEGALTKLHIFGKWHSIPRKQVTYGDAGLTYTYSGVTFSPKPWIPVLDRIRDRLHLDTGHSFNFVLINRYKDGRDHIGEHRDDERELVPGSPIASVSFGASRDFIFRHCASRGKAPSCRIEPVRLLLEHGSLLLMNFPTNRYWTHSLPSRKKVLAPRINLTFRKVQAL